MKTTQAKIKNKPNYFLSVEHIIKYYKGCDKNGKR